MPTAIKCLVSAEKRHFMAQSTLRTNRKFNSITLKTICQKLKYGCLEHRKHGHHYLSEGKLSEGISIVNN